MRKIYKRLGAVLCALGMVLMLAAGLTVNVSAVESTGNLTLYCVEDDTVLSGMQWSIYRVGKKINNKYTLGGKFSKYPVTFGELTVDDLTEAASTLENFVALDFLFPEKVGVTDKNGRVRFEYLETGIYLACGRRIKKDDYTYIPVPIIFEIDGKDKEINGYPKFLVKRTLPGDTDRYAVRKIWANADGIDKPTEITVEIYKDSVLNDTITLSQENNWTYSWDGDASSEWRVKEVTVPPGCFVMYRNNTTQYIIMNNYDNELLRQTTTTTTVTTTSVTTTTADIPDNSTTTAEVTTRSGPIDIGSTTATTTTEVTTTRSGPIDIGSTSATTTSTTTTTRSFPIASGEDTRTTTTGSKNVKPDNSTTSTTAVTTVTGDLSTSSGSSTSTGSGTSTDSGTSTSSTSSTSDVSTSSTKSTTTKRTTTPSGGGNGGGGNSYRTSKSTARTTTTTTEKLPQTGQLWWPVPVMLFGGIIFVAVGLRLLVNSRRED